MQLKSLFTLVICSLLFLSCGKEDDTGGGDPAPAVLGSAIFTVINCTDAAADPTCSTNFEVLAASKIFLYTSAEDREFNDPIFAEKLTNGIGEAEFSSLEGGDYFYTIQFPTDATVIEQDAFSIANGSRSQIRIEFNEEE